MKWVAKRRTLSNRSSQSDVIKFWINLPRVYLWMNRKKIPHHYLKNSYVLCFYSFTKRIKSLFYKMKKIMSPSFEIGSKIKTIIFCSEKIAQSCLMWVISGFTFFYVLGIYDMNVFFLIEFILWMKSCALVSHK